VHPRLPSPEERAEHALAQRVESLARWVQELETRIRVTEVATGDEDVARELRTALAALTRHDPALGERLGERIDVLGERLAGLSATVSATAASLAGKDGELALLRRELEAARGRIEEVAAEAARERDPAVLEELRRAVAGLARDVAARHGQEPLDALRGHVEALTERLDGLAETVAAIAGGLAGREGELAALRRRVEALAAGSPDATATAADGPRLEQLASRLAGVEREGAELASELAHVTGSWSSRLGSLEARLAELETARSAPDGEQAEEIGRLRILLDGLRMRVARTEKELAALAVPDDVAARLDDLVRRLDSLEQGRDAALAPLPGDGRFRLELRGLELRLRHLESQSSESREAVLTQLERLASRMEWRLHRLEAERRRGAEPLARVRVGGGQVVPLPERDG
jgi:chromosome segregation ATPase